LAWHRKKRSSDNRSSVSREHLQSAITEAVKKADPDCEAFVGVIVQRETPKSLFAANWVLRGVKFGRADRDKSGLALATVVKRMQREFSLAADGPRSAERPNKLKSDV
jgi:hypothetical protein